MKPQYYLSPYQKELDTQIVSLGQDEKGHYAVLSDTIFYPEGGGEPGDQGKINDAVVVDTQKIQDEIRHYFSTAANLCLGGCKISLNWERRFQFMQHHTAQHVITVLADKKMGWKTISFHLGEDYAILDLAGMGISWEKIQELEIFVNQTILQNHKVTSCFYTQEEYKNLTVRSRRLPENFSGELRIVSIENIDDNTCGGMHVASLAEIQMVQLFPPEKIKEGVRLPFKVGTLLQKYIHKNIDIQEQMTKILNCGLNDYVHTLHSLANARQNLSRNWKKAQQTFQEILEKGIENQTYFIFPGLENKVLTNVANLLWKKLPEKTIVVAGDDGESCYFFVRQGEKSDKSALDVFQQILQVTSGKGGGKGSQYQGKAEGQPAIDRLVAWLKQTTIAS
jgi:alanyl-tRNA synthetase